MSKSRASTLWSLALLGAVLPAQGEKPAFGPEMMRIAAGYAAKVTASAVFVSGRTVESVRAEEFSPDTTFHRLMQPFLELDVDRDAGTVTASIGPIRATAVRTPDLGCTLVLGDADVETLRQRRIPPPPSREDPVAVDWPLGERVAPLSEDSGIDLEAIHAAVDAAFAEPDESRPRRTRAIVVVHRGQLITERYRDGYDQHTLLPGWSMTKTLVDALIGIRVRQGELELDGELAVPEWQGDDPRRELRLPDLLSMTSGLAWFESYEQPHSDVLEMLFFSADHAAVQAGKPIAHPPGQRFVYSSGTTNLICRELRATFDDDTDYWAFPREQLFEPLGMHRALIETDPSGTFVGSSYGFATARDWARIGMLYVQDGTFAGKRLLPVGWAARAATATPSSEGRYGSQLWLNADPDGDGPRVSHWHELPSDLIRLDGHEGQHVIALPRQQLVVARLGCSKLGGTGMRELVARVLAACR